MAGREHYAEAERLLTLAHRHTRGVTYAQEWTLTLTVAQVHPTPAPAAATAVDAAVPDHHAWADVAVTRLSASKPEASSPSPPEPDRGPQGPVRSGAAGERYARRTTIGKA